MDKNEVECSVREGKRSGVEWSGARFCGVK